MSSTPPKLRTYHIDFVIWVKDGKGDLRKIWVEVKSEEETRKPVNESNVQSMKTWLKNCSKWRQARVTAAQNNAEFRIITEKQLD